MPGAGEEWGLLSWTPPPGRGGIGTLGEGGWGVSCQKQQRPGPPGQRCTPPLPLPAVSKEWPGAGEGGRHRLQGGRRLEARKMPSDLVPVPATLSATGGPAPLPPPALSPPAAVPDSLKLFPARPAGSSHVQQAASTGARGGQPRGCCQPPVLPRLWWKRQRPFESAASGPAPLILCPRPGLGTLGTSGAGARALPSSTVTVSSSF